MHGLWLVSILELIAEWLGSTLERFVDTEKLIGLFGETMQGPPQYLAKVYPTALTFGGLGHSVKVATHVEQRNLTML